MAIKGLERGNFCPLIKKDCVGLQCVWFTHIRGMNPQSGEEIDNYACSIAWLPTLMIENSNMQRQTGAAVESFRNEMVKAQDMSQQILISAVGIAQPKLISKD